MVLKIKELEYMLEETKTENRLYRDKVGDLEAISNVALMHGEEIRDYGEEQRIGGQYKHNPCHQPAEKGRCETDLEVVLKSITRTRDELNKVITKYSDL